MDRRNFLKTATAASLAAGLAPPAAETPMPHRPLGRTGAQGQEGTVVVARAAPGLLRVFPL